MIRRSAWNIVTGENIPVYNFTVQPGSGKVINKLNIRKGEPTTHAEIVEILSAGAFVTFTGFVDNGESVNGNTKWFRDQNGNYFWSGGVV